LCITFVIAGNFYEIITRNGWFCSFCNRNQSPKLSWSGPIGQRRGATSQHSEI